LVELDGGGNGQTRPSERVQRVAALLARADYELTALLEGTGIDESRLIAVRARFLANRSVARDMADLQQALAQVPPAETLTLDQAVLALQRLIGPPAPVVRHTAGQTAFAVPAGVDDRPAIVFEQAIGSTTELAEPTAAPMLPRRTDSIEPVTASVTDQVDMAVTQSRTDTDSAKPAATAAPVFDVASSFQGEQTRKQDGEAYEDSLVDATKAMARAMEPQLAETDTEFDLSEKESEDHELYGLDAPATRESDTVAASDTGESACLVCSDDKEESTSVELDVGDVEFVESQVSGLTMGVGEDEDSFGASDTMISPPQADHVSQAAAEAEAQPASNGADANEAAGTPKKKSRTGLFRRLLGKGDQ
jgi:hypothetical protein